MINSGPTRTIKLWAKTIKKNQKINKNGNMDL